jgi:hypothetical protein
MTNAIYPLFKQELMKGNANNSLNSAEGVTGVYAALIDTAVYTYSPTHQFYTSLSGVVASNQELLYKTQAAGLFDGSDVVFPSVTGDTAEAIVLYRKNAGASSTWALIAYLDTGVTGLPVLPNTGPIGITWNAAGIFLL